MRDNIRLVSDSERRAQAVETAGDVLVGLAGIVYGTAVAAVVVAVLWLRWGW